MGLTLIPTPSTSASSLPSHIMPQCPAQKRLPVEDSTHQIPAPESRQSCWGGEPAQGTLGLRILKAVVWHIKSSPL